MVSKFSAFAVTGSAAMLSEGIHSLADVGNQSLLAFGIRRSRRAPTTEHPYGYSRAKFIWALISAVGIFFVGCGVTVYHGVSALFHPHDLEHASLPVLGGVLLFALVVEGWTLMVAVRAVNRVRGDRSIRQYLSSTTDPLIAAVLLEDGAAVLGVLIAALCIGLSLLTGNPVFDAIGSIVIGLILGIVAILLVNRNRELLLGEAPEEEIVQRIRAIVARQPEVERVSDVKAVVLDTGRIRFKAEIDFDGRALTRRELELIDVPALHRTLSTPDALRAYLEEFGDRMVGAVGDAIDRIEAEATAEVPELAHVDLEAD